MDNIYLFLIFLSVFIIWIIWFKPKIINIILSYLWCFDIFTLGKTCWKIIKQKIINRGVLYRQQLVNLLSYEFRKNLVIIIITLAFKFPSFIEGYSFHIIEFMQNKEIKTGL